MSAISAGQRGLAAVEAGDWAGALPLLDRALEDSESPTWLLARAQAHMQLGQLPSALRDAELAYHTAAERGSRKLMIEAQYRRACVLNRLGRFADSDCCAKWSLLLCEGAPVAEGDDWPAAHVDARGCYTVTPADAAADSGRQPDGKKSMAEGRAAAGLSGDGGGAGVGVGVGSKETGFRKEWNRAYIWRSQATTAMEKLPQDHPGRKVTVTKVPPRPVLEKRKAKGEVKEEEEADIKTETKEEKEATTTTTTAPTQPAQDAQDVPDEKLKLRVDYYQNSRTVTVTVFAKNIEQKAVDVTILDHMVTFGPVPREAMPSLNRQDRRAHSTLFLPHKIDAKASRWSATDRKIELILQKAEPGLKWGTWGKEEIGIAEEDVKDGGEAAASVTESSSSGPTDTATMTDTTTANDTTAPTTTTTAAGPAATAGAPPTYPTSSKSGPKNWDKVAQAGDDEANEADQDVNFFFKKLYAGASDEQRRAMMKSFTESNGTSLSTDWNDVKSRTVETAPPEGVEAKKWGA